MGGFTHSLTGRLVCTGMSQLYYEISVSAQCLSLAESLHLTAERLLVTNQLCHNIISQSSETQNKRAAAAADGWPRKETPQYLYCQPSVLPSILKGVMAQTQTG